MCQDEDTTLKGCHHAQDLMYGSLILVQTEPGHVGVIVCPIDKADSPGGSVTFVLA